MTERRVPAARPVFSAEDRSAITTLIDQSLSRGSLTLGPLTEQLEEAFAARHGARHAVAVSSGTAALEIMLRSLDVEGQAIVVPTNTFFATAAAVVRAGARPQLADVDPDTLSLSVDTIEAALDEGCVGVILVHIGGLVTPQVDAIAELCRRRDVFLLEDAAHAHGAGFGGRSAGSFGRAAAFSFYPTKVMTSGEGGMILTDDERMRDEARIYRDQGKAGFLGGDHVRLGNAWRMSELHAAVGVVQLARLDEFVATRRRAAAIYDDLLGDTPGLGLLPPPEGCSPNYYKYVALLDTGIDRGLVKSALNDRSGVSLSGEVYARPLHDQPVFAELAHGPLPVADDVCARHICLPIHSDMTEDEAAYVAKSVREALAAIVASAQVTP